MSTSSKRLGFVFLALLAVSSTGCFGNLRKGTAMRLARKEFANPPACEARDVKTTVVRVIDDERFDFLAEVKAVGCGSEKSYLCGQSGANWACEAVH